jgi:hypothetical protein
VTVDLVYSDSTCFFAIPDQDLDSDIYTVTVSISDLAGTPNTQTANWWFTVPEGLTDDGEMAIGMDDEDSSPDTSGETDQGSLNKKGRTIAIMDSLWKAAPMA